MKPSLNAVNLNVLRVLRPLVEHRSVSKAARELGVTQSAVSHALRHLRALLDDPLLVRGPDGMMPTPAAERLADRFSGGFLEIERALGDHLGFDPATATREFTIAAQDHIAAIVTQSLVWMVPRAAPNVSFRVVDPSERLQVDLILGSAGAPHRTDLPTLRSSSLLSDRFVCVVRRDHPEVCGAISLAQLSRLPHVALARADDSLERLEDALAGAGVVRRALVTLPYFLLAPSLVPFSDLVLIVPRTLGELFAFGYPLQVLEPPLELPAIEERMYWDERLDHDPAQRWLRQQILASVEEFFARIRDQRMPLVGSWPEIPPGHRA